MAVVELSPGYLDYLRRAARDAAKRAYCPYSRFRVGSAVAYVVPDVPVGVYSFRSGCNVENASYGLTICAERNAIFAAVGEGDHFQSVAAVVIYTPTQTPTAPCGACRQVINEFGPGARIYSYCDGPDVIDTSLDLLLPGAFGPQNLA